MTRRNHYNTTSSPSLFLLIIYETALNLYNDLDEYYKHEELVDNISHNLIQLSFSFIENVPSINNGIEYLMSNDDLLLEIQFKVGASLVDKEISNATIERTITELLNNIACSK